MMKNCLPLVAAMLWTGAMIGFPALGQTVYRCANTYSQQPCPGAVTIDASDVRTPAQKAQTDSAAAQAAKAADKMEKDRLAREKIQAAKPPLRPSQASKTAKAGPSGTAPKPSAKRKKKEPEYFTAAVAPEKKEKKTVKKTGDKTQTTVADKTAPAAKP